MKKYLFLALAGLFAALVSGCETVYSTVFQGDNIVNNYPPAGDDDSAGDDIEEPTPAADDDSAEEPVPTEAFVYWDGFTDSSYMEMGPSSLGYPIVFGVWGVEVHGEPNSVAYLSLNFQGVVTDSDWNDGFTPGENGGFVISELVGNCGLYDSGAYGAPTMAAARNPEADGVVRFNTKPYPVQIGEDGVGFVRPQLQCSPVLGALANGEEAAVAFVINDETNVVVSGDAGVGKAWLLSDNWYPSEWSSIQVARWYIYFANPLETMNVFLSGDSNFGAVPAGWTELGRFVFSPDQESRLDRIRFTVDGWDGGGTGWLTCGEAMDPSKWNMSRREIDLFTGDMATIGVSTAKWFFGLSGNSCLNNPSEVLGYVDMYPQAWANLIVPSNTVAISFAVQFDASEASTGDWIQVGISDATAFEWTNMASNILHTGADGSTAGIPEWGNQLTFN